MGISEILDKFMNRSSRVKELEIEDRAQNKVFQKKLSANERELNRFLEEERQKQIKLDLEAFRKKREQEHWHTDTITQPDLFKGHNNDILKQENIFVRKGGLFHG